MHLSRFHISILVVTGDGIKITTNLSVFLLMVVVVSVVLAM